MQTAIWRGKIMVQRRTTRKDGWTVAKRAVFLDVLAQTANVTMAADAAGMKDNAIRRLRKRDGEFAALWAEAMDEAAERLREEILAEQLNQLSTGRNPPGGHRAAPAIPFDPMKAIAVLRSREGFGDRRLHSVKAATAAEIDALLMARLEALATRRARTAEREAARAAAKTAGGDATGGGGEPADDGKRA